MRYFLSVLLACAAFAGVSCGGKPELGVRLDAAFRPLVPPDTAVLAGVELGELKKTPLYGRYESQMNQAGLDAFTKRFGIDPRRDVDAVLVAANENGRIALARGRFTRQQLEPRLTAMGMRRTEYKGYAVFGDERNSLVLLKDGMAGAGTAKTVRALVDRASEGHDTVPKALQRQLATLPKDDLIWVVSNGGLPLAGMPVRQDVQSALANIEGFVTRVSAGAAVDSGIHLRADFDCISLEGAQRVHDALRGGIGLARLTTNDNALDMLRLYDSIKVSKDAEQVQVKADLPADLTDKVWAHLPQAMEHVNRALDRGGE